jgi:hypothetical protein
MVERRHSSHLHESSFLGFTCHLLQTGAELYQNLELENPWILFCSVLPVNCYRVLQDVGKTHSSNSS